MFATWIPYVTICTPRSADGGGKLSSLSPVFAACSRCLAEDLDLGGVRSSGYSHIWTGRSTGIHCRVDCGTRFLLYDPPPNGRWMSGSSKAGEQWVELEINMPVTKWIHSKRSHDSRFTRTISRNDARAVRKQVGVRTDGRRISSKRLPENLEVKIRVHLCSTGRSPRLGAATTGSRLWTSLSWRDRSITALARARRYRARAMALCFCT